MPRAGLSAQHFLNAAQPGNPAACHRPGQAPWSCRSSAPGSASSSPPTPRGPAKVQVGPSHLPRGTAVRVPVERTEAVQQACGAGLWLLSGVDVAALSEDAAFKVCPGTPPIFLFFSSLCCLQARLSLPVLVPA